MSKHVIGAAAFVLVALAGVRPAWPSNIGEATDHIDDSIDAARDAGGDCRDALEKKLKSLRADLNDDPDDKILKDILADLESMRKKAENNDCPKKVRSELDGAVDYLENEISARGGNDHKARARADCWDAADPACNTKRDKRYSMSKDDFGTLVKALGKADDDLERVDLCEAAFKKKYITVRQLAKLLSNFKKDRAKLDAVQAGASHVVDPDAGHLLMKSFDDEELGSSAVEAIKKGEDKGIVGGIRSKIGF